MALFNQEMAPVVAQFCAEHPDVQLSLLTYHNVEIESLLVHGELELAIIPHGTLLARNPLLTTEVLCQRRWHLVLAADHPLARKRRLKPADLVRYPWVLGNPERNAWARAVMSGLAQAGVLDQLQVSVRIDDSMTACHLAALGLGLTVSPYRPYLPADAPARVRPINDLFPTDHLVALWRRGVSLRPTARRFLDFVRRAMSRAS